MAGGVRRRGRAYALQVLYALDAGADADPETALAGYADTFELPADERAIAFARELVTAARAHRASVDDAIQTASRNWRLERMARVDRNILRLAACELAHSPSVPVKVVINEAVELAKRFGTAESPAFVNGILDRIAHNQPRRT